MNGMILAVALMQPVPITEPAPLPMPNIGERLQREQSRWQLTPNWVRDQWMLAVEYREFCLSAAAVDTVGEEWSAICSDARWRANVWNELDNVIRCNSPYAIDRLSEQLGEEAFTLRRLPMPCAPWYVPRTK